LFLVGRPTANGGVGPEDCSRQLVSRARNCQPESVSADNLLWAVLAVLSFGLFVVFEMMSTGEF